jgi:uncharacterized membrane protein
MRAHRLLLAALAALPLAAGGAAQAQDPPRSSDAMLVEGKRIPLPPGAWRVLGDVGIEAPPRAGQPGAPVALRSIVLGWVLEKRLVGLVVLRTNLAPVAGGFGLDRECRRRDLHMARVETPAAQTLAYCGTIAHVLHGEAADGRADPAWRAALAQLSQEGIAAPPAWLQVAMRFADQDDLLDIRYLFDPLLLGVPPPPEVPAAQLSPGPMGRLSARIGGWTGAAPPPPPEPSAWMRSGWGLRPVAADPVRTWVLGQLLDWYDEALPELRQGFKGRGGTLPWPRPWQVAFRLAPAPVPPPNAGAPRAGPSLGDLTPESEALWKTLSWRAVGSLLDLGVAYAFTGSAGAAGGIAMLGSFVNSTAYYVHELVWRDIGASGTPAEAVTDLPEVAIAR